MTLDTPSDTDLDTDGFLVGSENVKLGIFSLSCMILMLRYPFYVRYMKVLKQKMRIYPK